MASQPSEFDSTQVLPKSFIKELDAVRVSPIASGNILDGVQFDQIDAAYPDDTTEVYIYTLDMVVTATLTITYVDCSKSQILKVEKL